MKRLFFMASLVLMCACGGEQKGDKQDVIVETAIGDSQFVLVENQTKGLVGVNFNSVFRDETTVIEVLPVEFKSIEAPIWSSDNRLHEFIAADSEGVSHLIKYEDGFDYEDNYIVTADTVLSAPKINALTDCVNENMRYYLKEDGGKQSLVRVADWAVSESKAHDAIYPIAEIDTYLFVDNGKYGYVYTDIVGFATTLVESEAKYDDIFIYNMVSKRRTLTIDGLTGSYTMGEMFYCIKNGDGSYTMCLAGDTLSKIFTITAEEVADIRAHAGVDADARYVETDYFPESRITALYKAGDEATTWGIW
jgi:hypothetical protein